MKNSDDVSLNVVFVILRLCIICSFVKLMFCWLMNVIRNIMMRMGSKCCVIFDMMCCFLVDVGFRVLVVFILGFLCELVVYWLNWWVDLVLCVMNVLVLVGLMNGFGWL